MKKPPIHAASDKILFGDRVVIPTPGADVVVFAVSADAGPILDGVHNFSAPLPVHFISAKLLVDFSLSVFFAVFAKI